MRQKSNSILLTILAVIMLSQPTHAEMDGPGIPLKELTRSPDWDGSEGIIEELEGETLLVNSGFEGGTTRDTLYWTPDGGPYSTQFGEIDGPEGWVTWWREGFPCTGTSDWETGRPEVRVITAVPDPARIHGGEQAVQWFTFWRCSDGGLLQQVEVEPGHYYTFSAFAHAWYSRCSTRPHDPPCDTDCVTPIDWAHALLRVGIDPTGGIDPTASSVIWGQTREIYGVYGKVLTMRRVQAQEDRLTVFVGLVASHPLKHVDFFIDDAALRDVTYRAFLPIARMN